MLDMIDEKSAGNNARAKNYNGRQDDVPGVHWA
jgi:hypothetical protein